MLTRDTHLGAAVRALSLAMPPHSALTYRSPHVLEPSAHCLLPSLLRPVIMQLSPLIQFFNGRACLHFYHIYPLFRTTKVISNNDFKGQCYVLPLVTGHVVLVPNCGVLQDSICWTCLLRPLSPRRPTVDVKYSMHGCHTTCKFFDGAFLLSEHTKVMTMNQITPCHHANA